MGRKSQDLKIDQRRQAVIAKVQECADPKLLDDILHQLEDAGDADLQVTPITLEEYQRQTEEAIAAGERGELLSTEEVLAFLKR